MSHRILGQKLDPEYPGFKYPENLKIIPIYKDWNFYRSLESYPNIYGINLEIFKELLEYSKPVKTFFRATFYINGWFLPYKYVEGFILVD